MIHSRRPAGPRVESFPGARRNDPTSHATSVAFHSQVFQGFEGRKGGFVNFKMKNIHYKTPTPSQRETEREKGRKGLAAPPGVCMLHYATAVTELSARKTLVQMPREEGAWRHGGHVRRRRGLLAPAPGCGKQRQHQLGRP